MYRSLPTVLAVFTILILHVPLSAQIYGARTDSPQPDPARVGDRVRLDAPGLPPDTRIGRVVAVSPDGIRVALEGGGERDFTWNDLSRMEVSQGHGDYGAAGFLLGLLGGATGGMVSGLLSGDDRSETVRARPGSGSCGGGNGSIWAFLLFCRQPSTRTLESGSSGLQKGVVRGLIWSGVAGFVGVTVGKLVNREIWNEAAFGPPGTTLTPSVSGDGVGMSVRIPLGSP